MKYANPSSSLPVFTGNGLETSLDSLIELAKEEERERIINFLWTLDGKWLDAKHLWSITNLIRGDSNVPN